MLSIDNNETIEDKESLAAKTGATSEANGDQHSEDQKPAEEVPKSPLPKKRKYVIVGVVLVLLVVCSGIIFLAHPRYESIKVTYAGPTVADTIIDQNNTGIKVIGVMKTGEKKEIPAGKWTIEEAKTLAPDQTSTVTVRYKKLTADFNVMCSTSLINSIKAFYDGDDIEGTVISSDNPGLHVEVTYVNGCSEDVSKKCTVVNGPITLVRDSIEQFEVQYADPYNGKVFSEKLTVKCSTRTVVSISAKYTGSTLEGVKLNNTNDGIKVTGKYKDGETFSVIGWKISNPKTLEAEKASTVNISYEGKTVNLTVMCTSVTEKTYKSSCVSVSYDNLARNYNSYKGERITIKGRIFQIITEGKGLWQSWEYLVATSGTSKNLIHVRYWGTLETRLLEGDSVTIYGEGNGLYSYNTVLGAKKTVPNINAEYFN